HPHLHIILATLYLHDALPICRRNDLLFAWHNVPSPYFLLHLCGTTINGIISAARAGRFARMFRGIITGYGECVRHWHERRPVPRSEEHTSELQSLRHLVCRLL